MVNLKSEETGQSKDQTQVSGTGRNFESSSHRAIVQLNQACSQSLLPTAIGIRKAYNIKESLAINQFAGSFNQSTNAGNGANRHAYPAGNEAVAEATQWDKRSEKNGQQDLKQSESFLFGDTDCSEEVEEKPKQNNSLEPSETPENSQDFIQPTPMEGNSLRKRPKFKTFKIKDQTCSNEQIGDGSDSEILDMKAMGLSTERWKKLRKNSVNNISDTTAVCLGKLDQSEVSIKTIPLPKYQNNASISSEVKESLKPVQNNRSFSTENAHPDNPPGSDISLKQTRKKHTKHNGSLANILDDSEIVIRTSPKKWKKSNFSISKKTNIDELVQTEISRRQNLNTASRPPTTNVTDSKFADNRKLKREHKNHNSLREKLILNETKTTDVEESGENTKRSQAVRPRKDSCESEVETSILNTSRGSASKSKSDCEDENHLKPAKRKRKAEADDDEVTDQPNKTMRKKAKKVSTLNDSQESAGPVDSDRMLKFYLRLTKFNRDFKVPRLHKIVDRASKPTESQREQICLEEIEVKTCKFSAADDQQIQENWQNFIQVFKLEDDPQKFFCLNAKRVTPEAKRNFLFYLARGFTHRTPYSVFKRFKLLMDRLTKGRFSQEEDEFILKAMEEKPNMPLTEVAKHLHRSLSSVSCRMGKLKVTYSRKIKWRGRNAASYIKFLLKATNIDEKDIGLLKERPITATEWLKLSNSLDKVPVRILKPVWLNFLHPALFIPGTSCDLGQIKWKLAKRLSKNNETEWSSVDWSKYVGRFEGFTSLKLYTLLKQLIKAHVPEKKQANLGRSLRHLMKNKLLINSQPLKLLYKIKYRNGQIQDMRPDRE